MLIRNIVRKILLLEQEERLTSRLRELSMHEGDHAEEITRLCSELLIVGKEREGLI